MTKSYQVFVLGAGASKEVNLPVGAELRTEIARLLDIRYERPSKLISGDSQIVEAFRLHVQALDANDHDITPYVVTSGRIGDAMPLAASIDNFLDAHRTDERLVYCGKVAIARAILEAERQSSLYFVERPSASRLDFSAFEATWYNRLWQKLTENCQVDDLQSRLETAVVIDFNYDRCIEHFLYWAIQNYYVIDGNAAAEILRAFTIFHPYGKVGNLPWSSPNARVSFGEDVNSTTLNQLVTEIRTFTEGTDPDSSEILRIRRYVEIASSIVFLGFAYHRQNLDVLFQELEDTRRRGLINVYGTAIGISPSDCRAITIELSNGLGVPVDRVELRSDLTSSDLFREFGRSIAFV